MEEEMLEAVKEDKPIIFLPNCNKIEATYMFGFLRY